MGEGDRRPEGGKQRTGSRLHRSIDGDWDPRFQYEIGMKTGNSIARVRVDGPGHAVAYCDAAIDGPPRSRSGRQAMTVPSLTRAGAPPSRRVMAGAGRAGRGPWPARLPCRP
ncbi:Hypothetical protein RMHFA_05593 (plasmid) [Roseomonas mucosa]|nr:Hypothetical protein RMHFA_05597 [Roseomonas mucosa]UZO99497.1 Hypothetical protein RMHFA_05593 [Roseomonas mucosa]